MRIGCCTNMIASAPDGIGAEWIGTLAGLGYDYVELPLSECMRLAPAAYQGLRHALAAAGIPCEVCNNFFSRQMRLTGQSVDYSSILAYVTEAVRRAGELGARVIVFGSGPAKAVPAGFSHAQAYGQIVYLLGEIAPIAAGAGITLAIEPLRREECNIINTFREGCALADAVRAAAAGADNVKVLVDYYHLTCEKEDARHIAILGRDRLAHVHFAKAQGRRYPADILEDGGYPAFFGALAIAGYSGDSARISIEAFSEAEAPDVLAADAAAALRFLREQS